MVHRRKANEREEKRGSIKVLEDTHKKKSGKKRSKIGIR
jgi:hypothetical protein